MSEYSINVRILKIKKNWTADGLHGVWDRKNIILVHDGLEPLGTGPSWPPAYSFFFQPLSRTVWAAEKLPAVPRRCYPAGTWSSACKRSVPSRQNGTDQPRSGTRQERAPGKLIIWHPLKYFFPLPRAGPAKFLRARGQIADNFWRNTVSHVQTCVY